MYKNMHINKAIYELIDKTATGKDHYIKIMDNNLSFLSVLM